MMRIARSSVALVILALALVFLGLALTAPPAHASGVSVRSGGDVAEFGKNIYVGPGERVKSAVAFGGDITVAGTVQRVPWPLAATSPCPAGSNRASSPSAATST